jgi:hypothetical protein
VKQARLEGKKIWRLKVLSIAYIHRGKTHWYVRCDCGTTKILPVAQLSGNTKSCGCLQVETRLLNGLRSFTHGMSHTRTYQCWRSMKKRCAGFQERYRRDYTARGISFPKRWETFVNFLKDMGECPPGMTLERKNNSKSYSPTNCCWADITAQSRNRRSTIINQEIADFIRSSPLKGAQVARQLGVSCWLVYNVRQWKSWRKPPNQADQSSVISL